MHSNLCCLAGKDEQVPPTGSRDMGGRSVGASEQPCLLYSTRALCGSIAAAVSKS